MRVGAKTTVVFPMRDNQILLAMKKVRFGAGKWNGLGGKVDEGETPRQAAAREVWEEASIRVRPEDLVKIGFNRFFSLAFGNTETHIYVARTWEGEPQETEEMRPEWFDIGTLPYDAMWSSDQYWVPWVVRGDCFLGEFHYDQENRVVSWRLEPATLPELAETE